MERRFIEEGLPTPGGSSGRSFTATDSFIDFRVVAQKAPAGMALLDSEFNLLWANSAFLNLLGYSDEDVAHLHYSALVAKDGRANPSEDAYLLSQPQAPCLQRERCYSHRKGHPVWVLESMDRLGEDKDTAGIFVINVMDISERHRREQRWRYLAYHDPLTALPNRRRFQQDLQRHLQISKLGGPGGALVLLDLDGFKRVNDRYGHYAGDHVLMSLVPLLQASIRSTDVIARLGGDEFAILMPGAGLPQAKKVCQRLQQLFAENTISWLGNEVPVTASMGVALFPADGLTAVEVLRKADEAMYRAKEAGAPDCYYNVN